MKYIFLDNQIYIYMFERNDTEQLDKLQYLLSNNMRLVMSIETLIEFSQSNFDQAIKLTENVINLNPLWIETFANIQRMELSQFIDNNYPLKIQSVEKQIFHKDFTSLFDSKNITPLDFVNEACKNHKSKLDETNKNHQSILKQLLTYPNNQLYNKITDNNTLNNKICKLLPQDKLNELKFTLEDKRALVKYCIDNKKLLYKDCPSIQCEHYLAKYRTTNKSRKPKLSDSKDYTISIASFPYVDYFITKDGFLFDGLKYVKKHIPKNNTEIYKSLNEIM